MLLSIAMDLIARVTDIRQVTPTVKSFLLDLGTEEFTFHPGQWIDLYVDMPGDEELIGGFTPVSSPTRRGVIELAIKREGGGRAAIHMHDRARVGETFGVVGPGGQFYFQENTADSLALVAGGIGINPLICIIRYVDAKGLDLPVTLFYSARTPSELLFHEELRAIEARSPWLRCHFTVTRPGEEPWEGRVGRIDAELLREARTPGRVIYYICGPRGMPTEMDRLLREMGVRVETIQMEEW